MRWHYRRPSCRDGRSRPTSPRRAACSFPCVQWISGLSLSQYERVTAFGGALLAHECRLRREVAVTGFGRYLSSALTGNGLRFPRLLPEAEGLDPASYRNYRSFWALMPGLFHRGASRSRAEIAPELEGAALHHPAAKAPAPISSVPPVRSTICCTWGCRSPCGPWRQAARTLPSRFHRAPVTPN